METPETTVVPFNYGGTLRGDGYLITSTDPYVLSTIRHLCRGGYLRVNHKSLWLDKTEGEFLIRALPVLRGIAACQAQQQFPVPDPFGVHTPVDTD